MTRARPVIGGDMSHAAPHPDLVRGAGGIADVVRAIADKLVHRSPHVFGDVTASSAAEVDANWQRLKAERKQRSHATEGIPVDLPALLAADKVLGRVEGPVEGTDLGARLLELVQEARDSGLDAEVELRTAMRRHAQGGSR